MAITACICFCLIILGIIGIEIIRLLRGTVKKNRAAYEYALKQMSITNVKAKPMSASKDKNNVS